jgi:hypothetical protein
MTQMAALYNVPVCFGSSGFFLNFCIDRRTDGTANQLLTNS